MKQVFSYFLCAVVLLCSLNVALAESVASQSIELDKVSMILRPNETYALRATLTPANSDDTITWASSTPRVASVDQTGLVSAKKNGKSVITATTQSGKKASCALTVQLIRATAIKLNKTSITMAPGASYTLKTSLQPVNANDGVTFKSSSPSIATVGQDGVVYARKNGKATITASTKSGKKASATVTVRTVAVSSIKLNKSAISVVPEGTYKLAATVNPSNATQKTVSWSSKNSSIASVDKNGVVTAKSLGKTTITAKAGGRTVSCTVTVRYIMVSSIKLNKSTAKLGPNGTVQLTASVQPSNAHNKEVTWKSSNSKVASVNKNGLVTAGIAGNASITATAKDGSKKSASCKVSVEYVKVSSIQLNKTKATLGINGTLPLTARVSPGNAYNPSVQWTSSKPTIATVDENGLVTPLKEGETTITVAAKDGSGKKTSCKVTVKTIRATSITLNTGSPLYLDLDATHQLAATIAPTNADFPAITWASSDPQIVSISESGLLTAVSNGTATITIKTDKNRLTKSLTVKVGMEAPTVHRAVVLGSFSTSSRSGYLPFVNNDVKYMVKAFNEATIDGLRYQSVNYVNPITSKSQVLSALQSAFGNATDYDVSVLYIATHGRIGSVYFERSGDTLTYVELINALKSIRGEIVVIISACNSGSFIDQLKTLYSGDEISDRLSLLCAIQSGATCCGLRASTEEKSYDFFTGSLLLGIGLDIKDKQYVTVGADTNKDSIITFEELAIYTKVKTPANIKSYLDRYGARSPFSGNTTQVPQYYIATPDVAIFGSR